MSTANYAQMATDELLQHFIHETIRMGCPFYGGLKLTFKSPEYERTKNEIHAICAELRVRQPILKLRQLFEHQRPEIRAWASWQFASVDPEWAEAAFSGLNEDLTTREVLALRERALRGPPARPTVQEMSVDQLIERFEDAGMRKYATRFLAPEDAPCDVELNNRITYEMMDLVDELKSRKALDRLLPFLDHPNITLRNDAATHCLDIATERAISVLESIAASHDPNESGAAAYILDRWRDGRRG